MLSTDRLKAMIPPPPWIMKGSAIVVFGRFSRRQAVTLAGSPRGLLAPPLLGSIGTLALIRYDETPVGAYHEMIVSPGILWRELPGALLSHLIVDSDRSSLARRALWGLPMVSGSFAWGTDHVVIRDEEEAPQLTAHWSKRQGGTPMPLIPMPLMSRRGPRCQIFTMTGSLGKVSRAEMTLDLPTESHFTVLKALARGPHLAFVLNGFRLRISTAYDLAF